MGGALLLPSACSSMKLDDFARGTPPMALEEYFAGHSTAYGMFFDRSKDVRRQFVVQLDGKWDGSVLTLDEDFTYSDGEKQQRHWTFRKQPDGGWTGTAPDVVGEAHGRSSGNAYRMRYTADLKAGDSTYRVDFDDWLFRQSQDVVLNHAVVTKYGFDVGEVQLAFVKK
jgi:hypothetical protein